MALYNPSAGATDWRRTLQQTRQQPVSAGGQQAGLYGGQQAVYNPQARTAQVAQPPQQQAVYNAATAPSTNPDNVNWGVTNNGPRQPPGAATTGGGAGYGGGDYSGNPAAGIPVGYDAQSPYGGYYVAANYQGVPNLYDPRAAGYTTSDVIPDIFNPVGDSGMASGEEYLAAWASGINPATGQPLVQSNSATGLTGEMREAFDAFGTLSIDNPEFYAGLGVTPGMTLEQFAAKYGLDAGHAWVQKLFNNAMDPQINPTIGASGRPPDDHGPMPTNEGDTPGDTEGGWVDNGDGTVSWKKPANFKHKNSPHKNTGQGGNRDKQKAQNQANKNQGGGGGGGGGNQNKNKGGGGGGGGNNNKNKGGGGQNNKKRK